ncbi:MAG: hypothetical protein K6G55_08910 [Selenomonadaceae bacterium]|nr:hypothetical protein [Selenomonadaceae bacterium]
MTEKFFKKFLTVMCAVLIISSMNMCEAAKKVVAVMPFENASGRNDPRIPAVVTEQLTVALHSSGMYTVVERTQMGTILREQGFQNITVDPSKAVELGKLSGADYSMIGKITMVVVENNPTANAIKQIGQIFNLGNITGMADPFVNKFKSKVEFEFRLVDNTSGEIITAGMISGVKSGSSVESAFNSACKEAAENFTKQLDNLNPFRARIAEISGADIYIDRGSESGLRPGEKLEVVRESSPIVVNGKIVGMKHQDIGKIKVVEVFSDYSVCKIDKGKDIRKGDVVKR